MENVSYGRTTRIKGLSFEQVLEKATAALKEQGFGVITEIDVKATMKQKLDVDFRNYKILGACNPKLAHRALSEELYVGLLLPCNVVVFEDEGEVVVSAIDVGEMFKVVDRKDLGWLANEVGSRLDKVISELDQLGQGRA
jgi:uncharacterized protein (DUF302 family)